MCVFLPATIQNPEVHNIKVHGATTKWPFTPLCYMSRSTPSCEGLYQEERKKKLLNVQWPRGMMGYLGGGGQWKQDFATFFNSNRVLITQHFNLL